MYLTFLAILCLTAPLVRGQFSAGIQPYGFEWGDQALWDGEVDDEALQVRLPTPMPVNLTLYSSFWISSNGAVTLEKIWDPTAYSMGRPADITFASAYWDDLLLQVRCNGNLTSRIYHRALTRNDPAYQSLNTTLSDPYYGWVLNATAGYLITYDRVRHVRSANCSSPTNTFQLAFMYNETTTIGWAIYGDMQWVTERGMAGWSLGDGRTALEFYPRFSNPNSSSLPNAGMFTTHPNTSYSLDFFDTVPSIPFLLSVPYDFWDTTPAPPTPAPLHNGSFCNEDLILNITCRRGSILLDGQSPFESGTFYTVSNAEASTAVYSGDNSFACRKKLYDLHTYLYETAGLSRSKRDAAEAVEVTCYAGRLSLSDWNPEESEATQIRFRSGVSYSCRGRFLYFVQKAMGRARSASNLFSLPEQKAILQADVAWKSQS